jgi:hypothetical protein
VARPHTGYLAAMNWKLYAYLGLILLAGTFLLCCWCRPQPTDTHAAARQFVIQSNLDRFADPVVVLGDSIVEGSTLPRSLCGHAIINGGIGGASTTSGLGKMLAKSLSGKRAALVIISVGTNDAAMSRGHEAFSKNYRTLLKEVSTLAPRTIVMAIPPVEHSDLINVRIDEFNVIVATIARDEGISFGALSRMARPHTLDGVHLNAAGYETWDSAVLREASIICEKS